MNKKTIFLLLVLLTLGTNAFADSCALTGGGFLDSLLTKYFTSSSQWVTYLKPIAVKMYWFWFTCELLYQITFKKVLANDVNKLWYFLTIRIFTGTMFAYIFVNPDFYVGLILYFVKIGGAAGGFSINPTSSNPFGALSPSSVMNIGSCMWDSAYKLISGADIGGGVSTSGVSLPDLKSVFTIGMPVICMTLAAYVLAAIMAFTLFMTALEAYIVMNAGVILLGFAGSSWTQGFWNKYLSYVGGIAIRLFVMCLILGLVKDTLIDDLNTLNAAIIKMSTPGTMLSGMADLVGQELRTLIDMIICTFLVIKVPSMAGSMLTGSVNSGLGDVIAGASMMLAGAGLAKGLAKMGINMAGGSGNGSGIDAAKEKFKDSLRGDGSGGIKPERSGGAEKALMPASQAAKKDPDGFAKHMEQQRGNKSGDTNRKDPDGFAKHMRQQMSERSGSPSSSENSSDSSSLTSSGDIGNSGASDSPSSSSSSATSSGSTTSQGNSDSTLGQNNGNSPSGGNNPKTVKANGSSTTGNASTKEASDYSDVPANSRPIGSGSKSISIAERMAKPQSPLINSGSISGRDSGDSPRTNQKKNESAFGETKRKAGDIRRNLDKINQDNHSGAAEININPHRHE